MKLDASFSSALLAIEKERGIPVVDLKTAIETAFLSAYKKEFGLKDNVFVKIDTNTNSLDVLSKKEIVETVSDSKTQISLENALELFPNCTLGEQVDIPVDIGKDIGRFATNVAKQVISQKLREAEKKQIYNEYHDKKGQIVTASVQRLEKNNVILKLGKHEEVLVHTEQIPGEKFRLGDRVKVYISETSISGRGAKVILSRKHETFIQRLFEIEVPEINEGIISIKSISREAGFRTKIAVQSLKGNTDPVGAMIGARGARIKPVLDEIKGEKIDIVKWSNNPTEYISNALSPAKVISVKIIDKERAKAHVIVPDEQLSLAIGREGLNVKLAAKLTNFNIDIETESKAKSKVVEKTNYDD
ncbi:MAG: transcription termination factor NusA [Candidatus Sericytochromatia bacterium]